MCSGRVVVRRQRLFTFDRQRPPSEFGKCRWRRVASLCSAFSARRVSRAFTFKSTHSILPLPFARYPKNFSRCLPLP